MTARKVLVAEDDESIRMTLEFVLEDEGFDVLFAHDGEEALALARSELPDVILLDQMMPKMDGSEVLAALQAGVTTKRIPVFVMTGMARGDAKDWAGAHFIGKPFSPDVLVGHIRRVLDPVT